MASIHDATVQYCGYMSGVPLISKVFWPLLIQRTLLAVWQFKRCFRREKGLNFIHLYDQNCSKSLEIFENGLKAYAELSLPPGANLTDNYGVFMEP